MHNNGYKTHGITGYSSPFAQEFAPSPPQQRGQAVPIPNNQVGITAQRAFHKINKVLAPGPIARIVIGLQQARL